MDGRWIIVGSNSILLKKKKVDTLQFCAVRFCFFQHFKKCLLPVTSEIHSRGHCSIIPTATRSLLSSERLQETSVLHW